jgi:hypothetical protein
MKPCHNRILAVCLLFASTFTPPFLHAQPVQQVHPNPDCQFFFTLTAANQFLPAGSGFDNRQQGCTSWNFSYVNSGFTGLTVTLQSAANNNGVAGSWSAGFGVQQTTVSGSNAATSTTGGFWWAQGTNAFVRVILTGTTGTGVVNGAVYGWRIPNAASSGGGGGSIVCLTGDVAAGSGSGCTTATVQGIKSVPFCSGYTPTNGQFVQYTTGGSPNPCYTAASGGGGTIATTTNALKGDGAGNAVAVTGTSTNCVLVNGTSATCGGGGGGGAGLTVYSGLAGISLSNATTYFPIGGGSLASLTEANVNTFQGAAGTVSGFGVDISAALGTTVVTNNAVVLTWRKNAANQAVTCTITNPATTCSDTTHSFTFAAGDALDIQAVFTGTITATPVWVMNAGISSGSVASPGTITPNPAASAPTAAVPFTGWTLQNVSNARNSFNDFMPNELVMSSGNFGAIQWGAATRSIAPPYTLIATIETRGQINGGLSGTAGGGPFNAGICLSDGTKYETIELALANASANPALTVATLANLASNASAVAGPTQFIAGPTLTVKITNDSTNRTFFYWASGAWVQFLQETSGTFLTESTAGIISLNASPTGGYAIDVAIKYWSVQ